MTEELVLDIVKDAVLAVLLTASPLLILALTVGLLVSVFQAITSIQEPTLAFVPKILAVFGGLILFGPYMLNNLQELVIELFTNFNTYIS